MQHNVSKMAAADVVLDFASHFLDQDFCDSEVNCSGNCLRLKDYVKVELKSAQQIIRILHDEKANSYNLKNQVNLPNLIDKLSEDKLR
jgi:hypothetical protein